MKKSRCRACHCNCAEMTKLFDVSLGFVCGECFEFSLYADRILRRHGIEGVRKEKEKP